MNHDDFSAWKDSPATQWFFAKIKERADAIIAATAQSLLNSTGLTPAEWASTQARAAYDKGCSDAIYSMIEKEFADLDE